MLLVEGDHQDGLGVSSSVWRPEDEGIIINLIDLLDFTKLGAIHVFKLCVQRHIVSYRSILELELLEADATNLNACVS